MLAPFSSDANPTTPNPSHTPRGGAAGGVAAGAAGGVAQPGDEAAQPSGASDGAAGSPEPSTSSVSEQAEREFAQLTEREQAMLEFEKLWWRHPGAKGEAIQDRFGVKPTRYFQQLNRLIDRPEALDFDPVLVHRLLRRREQ